MGELLLVAVLAAVWWIPTFVALTDLQARAGVPRPLVWKWTAVLCVPLLGWLAYRCHGRRQLDAAGRSPQRSRG